MMKLDLIAYGVFTVLQVITAIVITNRRDYRRYPLFSIYLAYSVTITAIQLAVMHWQVPYFVVHFIGEVLYGLLGLFAIAEVFSVRLQLIYERFEILRYLLVPTTLSLLLGISVWRAVFHPFGPSLLAHLTPGAWGFVISVRALETGLYIAGWTLRKTGKIALADRPFTILKGFGLAAFFSLLAYLARYRFGPEWEPVFRYIPFGAYIASTVLWLRAFLKPEPPHTGPAPQIQKVQGLLDFVREERKTLGKLKFKPAL